MRKGIILKTIISLKIYVEGLCMLLQDMITGGDKLLRL